MCRLRSSKSRTESRSKRKIGSACGDGTRSESAPHALAGNTGETDGLCRSLGISFVPSGVLAAERDHDIFRERTGEASPSVLDRSDLLAIDGNELIARLDAAYFGFAAGRDHHDKNDLAALLGALPER